MNFGVFTIRSLILWLILRTKRRYINLFVCEPNVPWYTGYKGPRLTVTLNGWVRGLVGGKGRRTSVCRLVKRVPEGTVGLW